MVCRAIQQPLGREVALKSLKPALLEDASFLKRFENEARTLARLDHPNILPIYDFDQVEEIVYLAMPLVRGGALRDQRALRLMPGNERRLGVLLKGFAETMDRVRGEHAHEWRRIDDRQYWLVHYANLYAWGRRKTEKSCDIWTASIEAMLRWARLANDWYVEEIECGTVTGTYDCLFAVRSVKT